MKSLRVGIGARGAQIGRRRGRRERIGPRESRFSDLRGNWFDNLCVVCTVFVCGTSTDRRRPPRDKRSLIRTCAVCLGVNRCLGALVEVCRELKVSGECGAGVVERRDTRRTRRRPWEL